MAVRVERMAQLVQDYEIQPLHRIITDMHNRDEFAHMILLVEVARVIYGNMSQHQQELFVRFHDLVTGKLNADVDAAAVKSLGSLRALGGVARFPIRVKCASMAWHALR